MVSVVAQEVLVVPEILVGEPLYNSSHNAIKLKILAGGSKSNTFSTHSEYILQWTYFNFQTKIANKKKKKGKNLLATWSQIKSIVLEHQVYLLLQLLSVVEWLSEFNREAKKWKSRQRWEMDSLQLISSVNKLKYSYIEPMVSRRWVRWAEWVQIRTQKIWDWIVKLGNALLSANASCTSMLEEWRDEF